MKKLLIYGSLAAAGVLVILLFSSSSKAVPDGAGEGGQDNGNGNGDGPAPVPSFDGSYTPPRQPALDDHYPVIDRPYSPVADVASKPAYNTTYEPRYDPQR